MNKKNIESRDIQDEHTADQMKVMNLFDHLSELRTRFLKSGIALLVLFILGMVFAPQLIEFLKQPLVNALPDGANNLHFTGPLDVFLTGLKVAFMASLIFSCPVWIYQFWRFIEPALYDHEKKYILPFIGASISLFVLGVGFCFYLILPLAMEFLIGIGLEVGTPIITITDYISLLSIMILGFGIVFEAPLILVLLAFLDLLSAKDLVDFRKFVLIVILVLSAILTPPDPMSQIGMAIPLYIMYEGSIIIIKWIEKRRAR